MKGGASMNKPQQAHFTYFTNTECEFFPCHPTEHPEDFNCMFCYCPLYTLGRKCNGNYVFLPDGTKDCSACMIPHKKENFTYITARFEEIADLIRQNEKQGENE